MSDNNQKNQTGESWVPSEGYAVHYFKKYDMSNREVDLEYIESSNKKVGFVFSSIDYSKFVSSHDPIKKISTFNLNLISETVFKNLIKSDVNFKGMSKEYEEFVKTIIKKLFTILNHEKHEFVVPSYKDFVEFFFQEDVLYVDRKSKEFPLTRQFGTTKQEAETDWYFRIRHYYKYDFYYGGKLMSEAVKQSFREGFGH